MAATRYTRDHLSTERLAARSCLTIRFATGRSCPSRQTRDKNIGSQLSNPLPLTPITKPLQNHPCHHPRMGPRPIYQQQPKRKRAK